MTTEEIAIACDLLVERRQALCEAAFKESDLKFDLDKEEAAAILAGKITGKNPEERKAQILMMFIEDRQALLATEQDRRVAQMEYDIAEAKTDSLKLQMRLMEWTQ